MAQLGAARAAQAAAVALELPRHPGQGLLEHEAAALVAIVTVHDVRRVEEVPPAGAAAVGKHLVRCGPVAGGATSAARDACRLVGCDIDEKLPLQRRINGDDFAPFCDRVPGARSARQGVAGAALPRPSGVKRGFLPPRARWARRVGRLV